MTSASRARAVPASEPVAARTRSAASRTRGSCSVRDSHLAGEHGGGGGRAADHRRVRALHRGDLQPLVERLGEHHERAAVVAGDDDEHDRAAEVRHRPADLGAVLELPAAHRLRRAVEAGQVRQHDQRSVAAGRVDRAGHLARRLREQRAGRSTTTGRRPARSRAGTPCATRCPSRHTGMPPMWASHTIAVSASRHCPHRSSGSRVGVGHGPHHRPDVERLLALGVVLGGEDVADRGEDRCPRRRRAARSARPGRPGRSWCAAAGSARPGTT